MRLSNLARHTTSLICLLATTLAACGGSHRAMPAAPGSSAQQQAAPGNGAQQQAARPPGRTFNAADATAPNTTWLRKPRLVQGSLSPSNAPGLPTGQRHDLVFQIAKKLGHECCWVTGFWETAPHQTLEFSGPEKREGTYRLIDELKVQQGEITLELPGQHGTGTVRAVIFSPRAEWQGALSPPQRPAELPGNATLQLSRLHLADLLPGVAPESPEPLGPQLFIRKLTHSEWALENLPSAEFRFQATLTTSDRPGEYAAQITIEPRDPAGNQMLQMTHADGLCQVTRGADGSLELTLLSTKPRARLWLEASTRLAGHHVSP